MATWNGVITNAGNSLLNEWVNEKTLNFDSAAAGQGTVAAAAMMAQTALVNEKHACPDLSGKTHLMGNNDHCHAFVCKSLHKIKNLADHLGVKSGGWLIKQNDIRIHGKRTDDGNTLFLTA